MTLFAEVYGLAAIVLLCSMTALWILSLILRDAGIADVFWGAGFVIAAVVYYAHTPEGFGPRKTLVISLVGLWGLRLSLHILMRNWGKGEDFRYRKWRETGGPGWWWRSFFKVFLLQGGLMWTISAPLLAAQIAPVPARLTGLDELAVLIWAVGFLFESVGDRQLARFRSNPANRGRLLRTGLWRYTRHPNYFGDAVQWWGLYLFAAAAQQGYWTVFSPILMTLLLVRVSGVTLLESSLKATKPGYRDYIDSTSAFFPWFPRKQ